MMKPEEKDNPLEGQKNSTGDLTEGEDYKIISIPFDKYEVKLKLTFDNKFLEILEIRVNKDFMTFKQKSAIKKYHDVDKYYPE